MSISMFDAPDQLWWQQAVIYQVYPRSFQDTNGDGIGDLEGVLRRLDYLSETLGVDAIWLSPFYPSPDADFGYDITDFKAVDPRLGTLETFDRVLREVHARRMRLIVDLVVTYTSDQHPWFIEARRSRQSAKRDWFMWADAKADGAPPNYWQSAFGGSCWEWDAATQQYYYHSFTKHQPDLNWRNPEVREAMLDVARFWLERGVDGFRVDAAHWILKDPELRDNPPNTAPRPAVARALGEYDSQLHLYDKGHPDCHEVFRAYRRLIDSYSTPEQPRFAIGEIHVFDWQEWAKYYGAQLDELHMPYNFSLVGAPWQPEIVRSAVEGMESVLPRGAWGNYVLGNHDETRLASRLGEPQARVATLLLLTLRGTPTMYYGDEIGMVNGVFTPDQIRDPWGKNDPSLGRYPARTPMQWDDSPNAGFCPEGVQAWLPVNPDYKTRNVAAQLAAPRSMLNFVRHLLRLRQNSRTLQQGSYRTLEGAPQGCYAYYRATGAERLVVALNFTDQALSLQLPSGGRILISTHMDRNGRTERELTLRANEGCLVALG
jgi:alpha-glucosidase